MGKVSTRTRRKRRARRTKRRVRSRNQFLPKAQEQILRAISVWVETSVILIEICRALDFQIGGVVSYISRPGDDPGELAGIVMRARLYGLSTFCSESVVSKDKRPIGTLEMYCCDPRSPTAGEHRLIERAKRLAGLAIERDGQRVRRGNTPVIGNPSVSGHFNAQLEHIN